jgi:C-terminal processing protease CtpA/Prc
LPTLPKTAGHEQVLIVDLRGNDGGDAPVEAMARWLDLASVRPAFKFERRQPKSCLYDALRWGYTQVTIQNLKPPISDALRGNLQRSLDGLFAKSPEGCPMRMEVERSDWNYRKHRYPTDPVRGRPRLLVLVDEGCGSDCEYMAYVLAANPGSVIAGQNTYGVGQFIQPGYFILPNSRVKFRIALGMSDDYGDGRSFDGYGLDVDVVLDAEARSAASILTLAKRLAR